LDELWGMNELSNEPYNIRGSVGSNVLLDYHELTMTGRHQVVRSCMDVREI
jgi:hypothetical protein